MPEAGCGYNLIPNKGTRDARLLVKAQSAWSAFDLCANNASPWPRRHGAFPTCGMVFPVGEAWEGCVLAKLLAER